MQILFLFKLLLGYYSELISIKKDHSCLIFPHINSTLLYGFTHVEQTTLIPPFSMWTTNQ